MSLPFGFSVDEKNLLLSERGRVPLIFWRLKPNFGDLLSPWLIEKMSGRAVEPVFGRVRPVGGRELLRFHWREFRRKTPPNYVAIGSILSRARANSLVWGAGSFGTEQSCQLNPAARYFAVRGPLSRQLLLNAGADVPPVYGDPALLTPLFFADDVPKTHDIGLVLRWSETSWLKTEGNDQIKIVDLGSSDVERTLREMLSCRNILSSSLHGLIIADAYGIPNAFLSSNSPKGGEFKFFDYFASVDKFRKPLVIPDSSGLLDLDAIQRVSFDGRPISFDSKALLAACPFLTEEHAIERQA